MILLIYIINTLIRLVCGWGMFYTFSDGNYILASFCLLGAMKRNWLVFDWKYTNSIKLGIDNKNDKY